MKVMKKIAALGAAGLIAATALCGCGSGAGAYDPAATVATYGETAITAAEASYYIRGTQYSYESVYGTVDGLWEQNLSDYQTLADVVKESALSTIYQTYVLCDHAEEMNIELTAEQHAMVVTAAEEFMNGPTPLVEAVGAEQAEIEAILERNAVAMLVHEALVADVDTNVSDEEARHAAVSVIALPASSDAYDDAEEMKDTLTSALGAGSTMEDLTDTYEGLSVQHVSVGDGDYAETFGPEAFAMSDGDIASVYVEETDTWYVLVCDAAMDESGTEAGRAEIINERKAEIFEATYAEWNEAAPEFVVDEDVLATIDFAVSVTAPAAPAQTADDEEETE